MLSNCIFSLHFSYNERGWAYCQMFKNHLYPHPFSPLLGFYWFTGTLHILRVLVFCDKYLMSNISSCYMYGRNHLLEFSDINCTYFKFFCLFYYSRMWADLWKSLYTCLLCLLKPASVIMGERQEVLPRAYWCFIFWV